MLSHATAPEGTAKTSQSSTRRGEEIVNKWLERYLEKYGNVTGNVTQGERER
jgi:hypothetical protein